MKEFKPGDKIRRIETGYYNVEVGDIVTVKSVDNSGNLNVEEVTGGYSKSKFELVEPAQPTSESILTNCL